MSEYQLLGLDDYVAIDKYRKVKRQYLSGLEDYKDCLPTGKTIPNINNFDYNDLTNKKILAAIFKVSNTDDWSSNGGAYIQDSKASENDRYKPLLKTPELLSTMTHGAVFKDNLNNTIIIGASGRNEYFSSTAFNSNVDLYYKNKLNGANYFLYTSPSPDLTWTIRNTFYDNNGKQFRNIINVHPIINKKKVNYPIILDFYLSKNTFLGIDLNRVIEYVNIACALLSIIGFPEIATALQVLLQLTIEAAKNNFKNLDVLKSAILTATSILGVNETTAKNIINQGVDIVDLFNKKDYVNLSQKLNLATGDIFGIADKLKSATEYYNSLPNPIVGYQLHKKEYQATQDALLTSYSIQSPNMFLGMIANELQQNKGGGQLMNYITQIAVGRAADKNHTNFAALPPIEGTQGSLSKVLIDSGQFNTPELFKFVLDMEAGGQVDDNVLNYLLIEQIEKQIRDYEIKVKGLGASNNKTIFLPYAIDTIKGACIAKELNTMGYSVIWDNGRLDNTTGQVIIENNPLAKEANYYLGE